MSVRNLSPTVAASRLDLLANTQQSNVDRPPTIDSTAKPAAATIQPSSGVIANGNS